MPFMLQLFVTSIVFAVVCTNIHWHWTDSGPLVGIVSMLAGWMGFLLWFGLRWLSPAARRRSRQERNWRAASFT
jgi:hypothetical protein